MRGGPSRHSRDRVDAAFLPKPDPHYVVGTPTRRAPCGSTQRKSSTWTKPASPRSPSTRSSRLTTDGELFDRPRSPPPTHDRTSGDRAHHQPRERTPGDRSDERPRRRRSPPARGNHPPHRAASGPAAGRPRHVRLRVLEREPRRGRGGARRAPLAVTAAPRARSRSGRWPRRPAPRGKGGPPPAATAATPGQAPTPAPPMRLPEVITQRRPHPGRSVVRLDSSDGWNTPGFKRQGGRVGA